MLQPRLVLGSLLADCCMVLARLLGGQGDCLNTQYQGRIMFFPKTLLRCLPLFLFQPHNTFRHSIKMVTLDSAFVLNNIQLTQEMVGVLDLPFENTKRPLFCPKDISPRPTAYLGPRRLCNRFGLWCIEH